jgi:hypothetical protein
MGVISLIDAGNGSDEYLAYEQRRNEPAFEPGQIWVVECEAASLRAFHTELLSRASVVLYDRALVTAVAEALPLGVYAEPLPATAPAGPSIAPRAVEFAADGWSVLQLVETRPGRRQLLRCVTEDLNRTSGIKAPLLAIGTISASRYRYRCDTAKDLAIVAAALPSDELLSLTFASPVADPPAPGQVFTANGLAG